MRICQVVHGFPPVERTGVENYTLGLCRALASAGHRVEVFVPRRDPQLADLALRREEQGGFAVNWITNNHVPENPREALLVPELEAPFAAFLERERPEVVHFQHLIKLGLGLVELVRARGIPTVYTAHDYYPICHRYTLLRPDLTRCDVRGDSRACARCDLAVAQLNEAPGLGDYHAGALREQLSPSAWSTLEALLADRLEEHGLDRAALDAAEEQRAELDRLRRDAYRAFDLVLAPSRYLIEELVRGGFERERIEHQPIGFANDDLAGRPPVRPDPKRAVRFAFLGGLEKHKGVHLLLDAFARLPGGAELSIWGGSSDTAYGEILRKRCGEVGAQWRGAYERADLPRILGQVDVLVVPSIWVENYPLVIREGFSAGRPVLASRLGALAECVQDGVDGLLFAPNDVEDLARTLRRCLDEPGLLATLARGIRPVKGMAEEARELLGRYEQLRRKSEGARARGELPQSLKATLARFEAHSMLPSRELFARVLAGLDDLREAWSEELGPVEAVELLASGLGEGSEAQDRLREARNEIAWLRTKKEELDDGREELMTLFEDLDQLLQDTRAGSRRQSEHLESAGAYVRQKEEEVLQAHARIRELEAVIAQKNEHIGTVEDSLQDAGRYIRHKEQEYRDVEAELRKAADFARTKEEEYRDVEGELRKASDFARTKEEELRLAREQSQSADGRTRGVAQVARLTVDTQARVLNRSLHPIFTRLHALLSPGSPLSLPADGASFAEVLRAVRQAQAGLEAVAKELEWLRPMRPELEWRRERMSKLIAAYERHALLRMVVARTSIGRKLREWNVPPGGSAVP